MICGVSISEEGGVVIWVFSFVYLMKVWVIVLRVGWLLFRSR